MPEKPPPPKSNKIVDRVKGIPAWGWLVIAVGGYLMYKKIYGAGAGDSAGTASQTGYPITLPQQSGTGGTGGNRPRKPPPNPKIGTGPGGRTWGTWVGLGKAWYRRVNGEWVRAPLRQPSRPPRVTPGGGSGRLPIRQPFRTPTRPRAPEQRMLNGGHRPQHHPEHTGFGGKGGLRK